MISTQRCNDALATIAGIETRVHDLADPDQARREANLQLSACLTRAIMELEGRITALEKIAVDRGDNLLVAGQSAKPEQIDGGGGAVSHPHSLTEPAGSITGLKVIPDNALAGPRVPQADTSPSSSQPQPITGAAPGTQITGT